MKFKPGDKVIRTSDDYLNVIRWETYTVSSIHGSIYMTLEWSKDQYSPSCFDLLNEEPEEATDDFLLKFKAWDHVRLVPWCSAYPDMTGIYTVDFYSLFKPWHFCVLWDDNDGPYYQDYFELVPIAPELSAFNIGDRVKYICNDNLFEFWRECIVRKIFSKRTIQVTWSMHYYNPNQFQLIAKAPSKPGDKARFVTDNFDNPEIASSVYWDLYASSDFVHVSDVSDVSGVSAPTYSSTINPITPMATTINDYAIKSFMDDQVNINALIGTKDALNSYVTKLNHAIDAIARVRDVVSQDEYHLSEAVKNSNLVTIERILSEQKAVNEYLTNFLASQIESLIPAVDTTFDVQSKFSK